MNTISRLRTIAALIAVCLAGGATAVAVADSGPGSQGTTNDDSTGTTGDTTTGETTTGETTTGETTNTTTTGSGGARRAPLISEIEVDSVSGDRLRLRAEISRRGSRITKVRFTYRGVRYAASRTRSGHWSRVVGARGGDGRGDEITFRVTACSGSRCASRTGSDEAGGGRRNRGGDDNRGSGGGGGGSDDDGTPDQGSGDN